MSAQINHNFKYHPPVGNAAESHAAVRLQLMRAAEFIDSTLPPGAGREKALAITKIEEAMMWACAGIARHTAQPGDDGNTFQSGPDIVSPKP